VAFYTVQMINDLTGVNDFDREVDADGPQAAREQARRECPGHRAGTATAS
jgi:hypothetical protein